MARQLRLQRRGSGHGDEDSGDEDSAEATPTEASSQHVGAQRGAIPQGGGGGGGRFENTGFFGLNVHPFHRISTYVCTCASGQTNRRPRLALTRVSRTQGGATDSSGASTTTAQPPDGPDDATAAAELRAKSKWKQDHRTFMANRG